MDEMLIAREQYALEQSLKRLEVIRKRFDHPATCKWDTSKADVPAMGKLLIHILRHYRANCNLPQGLLCRLEEFWPMPSSRGQK